MIIKGYEIKPRADLRRADLRGTDLRRANLYGADLSFAYLSKTDLSEANLQGANLSGANLHEADLRGVNLDEAILRGALLRGANLSKASLSVVDLSEAVFNEADLSGAYLSEANLKDAKGLPEIAVVPNLHTRILELIESGKGKLDMSKWHKCETTHCRAGWAIYLAGEAGRTAETLFGPGVAGALITLQSCPYLDGKVPDWLASNEEAMEEIKRCAEIERRCAEIERGSYE